MTNRFRFNYTITSNVLQDMRCVLYNPSIRFCNVCYTHLFFNTSCFWFKWGFPKNNFKS